MSILPCLVVNVLMMYNYWNANKNVYSMEFYVNIGSIDSFIRN